MPREFVSAPALGNTTNEPEVMISLFGPPGGTRAIEGVTPDTARKLARNLIEAADKLEGKPPPAKRVWFVCNKCGSQDIEADAYAHWNVDDQRWEAANVMDKGHFCNSCEGETRLDDVEIVPDHDIPEAIRKAGWFLNECLDGKFNVKDFHGDPDAEGAFDTLDEAYLWALYHEPEK